MPQQGGNPYGRYNDEPQWLVIQQAAMLWEGLAGTGGEELETVREMHRRSIAQVAEQLSQDDLQGKFWPAGLLTELTGYVAKDTRYTFLQRLPRSAHFGELLATEYEALRFGCRSSEVRECGRLTNLFVTMFDSVCDDIPEFLPDTLHGLNALFATFPRKAEALPLRRSLSGLTLGCGYALATRLGKHLVSLPAQEQAEMTGIVHRAYTSQLRELSVGRGSTPPDFSLIEAKSAGPFAVLLGMVHAVHGNWQGFACVQPLACSLGQLFGWIDDLVDWEEDGARGKTTSLSCFLDQEVLDEQTLRKARVLLEQETAAKAAGLLLLLREYGLADLAPPLTGVLLDWVGQK